MEASFIVTYSRNWDGGGQERDTAVGAIRSVFPSAEINVNCVDVYPIKVVIEAKVGKTKVKIWEGRQQDLFRKYSSKRSTSIQQIVANLNDLKEDFE